MSEVKAIAKAKKQPLVLEGDPKAQLDYAQKAASALMERVNMKKKKVIIGGKEYLEFGDWQTLARFFGATVGVEWTKPIERGGKLEGYEARAIVYQHGETISAAEASCLRSERNWKDRDEFAVKSMAQTRASAKALRNAFGWVAELAGYASTPAEEMNEEFVDTPKASRFRPMTEKQLKWLRDTAHEVNDQLSTDAEVDEFIAEVLNWPIDKIPSWKTKEAVDKLKEWSRQESERLVAENQGSITVDEVVELSEEEAKNGINLDDYPY